VNEALWKFVAAAGELWSKSYGVSPMTGRVLAWLLVCEPAEQTATELAEALNASKGSISGATGMLVRAHLVDRLRVRGERADRFRLRRDAWDEQIRDQGVPQVRSLIVQGMEALADQPPARRARLEELDAFYAWYESRIPVLWEEWQEYKRVNLQERAR
jgi:DNA-binding transcriptional regulator GbsR (MarR family)